MGTTNDSGFIYICNMSEILDLADEERSTQQFSVLGSILDKLGYRLCSGTKGHFDECWAMPVPRSKHEA